MNTTALTSVLCTVFFLSGMASLVYQVVWQRLMTVYYGVGDTSTSLIVSVFMLGLGIGALIGGYLADRAPSRARLFTLYLILELVLATFGAGSLYVMDALGRLTTGQSYLVMAGSMFLFLCVPTTVMGMMLPVLVKIFSTIVPDFSRNVSLLYFINTIGAALGCIAASYVLITFLGLDGATFVAAAVNLLLAAIVLILRVSAPPVALGTVATGTGSAVRSIGRWAYAAVFVTGFLAIGYEIIWFRFVGVLVKASPYAFASTLSVYLAGIALGSAAMNVYIRRGGRVHRDLFFILQGLVGLSVAAIVCIYYYGTAHTGLGWFTAESFAAVHHPAAAVPEAASFLAAAYARFDVLLWPLCIVLVPTMIFGASFPLIAGLALTDPSKQGGTIGRIYLANILGNVAGGLITGFLILPAIGTENAVLVFVLISVSFGVLIGSGSTDWSRRGPMLAAVGVLGIAAFVLLPRSPGLYRLMHTGVTAPIEGEYFAEGKEGVIYTLQRGEHLRNFINGLAHGGRPGSVFVQNTIEALAHAERLDEVLIIGFGTGAMTETVLASPEVGRITLVELNRTLLDNLRRIELFERMLDDPRIEIVIDDGRRLLHRTDRRFDLVLMDPLRSTTAYSNNLYSKEFYELVRSRMNPDGLLFVWADEHRIIPRTLATVFPDLGRFPYFTLAGSQPIHGNDERRRDLISRLPDELRLAVVQAGRWSRYKGDRSHVLETTDGSPINLDWRPRCEYYLGLPRAWRDELPEWDVRQTPLSEDPGDL